GQTVEIRAELPRMQTAVAGSFDPNAALAVARSDGENLAFRNAVAILSFVIRNDGITSIRLSSNNPDVPAAMTGQCRIDYNEGNPLVTPVDGFADVSLYGNFVKGNRYYMVVFPGTYNSLELTFTDASGRTAHYYNPDPLELERNSNVNLFDLEIPEGKWEFPSIVHSDNITVPADGVTSEITEVLLNNSDGWNVRVECTGCVSSAVWDEEEGGVCYSVAKNTTTQPRTGTIKIILSRNESDPEITSTIQVTQEAGAAPPPVEDSWLRVESSSDLVAGDEYVIACSSSGVVATDINGQIMGSVSASFSSDYKTITTLPSSAIILTLGGSTGSWTFSNSSGSLLGCTAVKKLAWGSGATTWTISINSGTTPITSTSSGYGTLQYNTSSPRFTTYTSTQAAVTLYHKVGATQGTRVNTHPVASGITTSSASIYATYFCLTATPSSAGFKYGTNSSSLTATATASVSGTSGTFSATLSNLNASTTYYYAAFIVENGITYNGSVQSFTTNSEGGTPTTGGADYPWPELPAQTDRDRNGIDDNNSDLYYSHTFRADASTIRNFSSCYSKSKIHPVWVAAPMHSCYLGGSGRNDSYGNDPGISCYQAPKFSGYTRGHMIGSSDRTVSVPTNRQVFYYSNIGAQTSSGFNTGGGAWNNLEAKVDTYLCADTLYQVVGCIFDTFTDSSGVTVTPPATTSQGSRVPTAWYKVLLRTKNGNTGKDVRNCSASELKCVAFILGHYSNAGHTPTRKDMYTVRQLEQMTGLTFFVNVPNAPKDTYNAAEWGL
ncbi:MAG: DNA/RNA non-specific endonuclease, partial [Bacteroidales bacterium]|nr:DNA/RNA non-specific endonuclease [Bacteroidales bacterium]